MQGLVVVVAIFFCFCFYKVFYSWEKPKLPMCVWYRLSATDTSLALCAFLSGWRMNSKAFTIINPRSCLYNKQNNSQLPMVFNSSQVFNFFSTSEHCNRWTLKNSRETLYHRPWIILYFTHLGVDIPMALIILHSYSSSPVPQQEFFDPCFSFTLFSLGGYTCDPSQLVP